MNKKWIGVRGCNIVKWKKKTKTSPHGTDLQVTWQYACNVIHKNNLQGICCDIFPQLLKLINRVWYPRKREKIDCYIVNLKTHLKCDTPGGINSFVLCKVISVKKIDKKPKVT